MNNQPSSCLSCLNSACYINKYCSSQWKSVMDKSKEVGKYNKEQVIFYEDNIVRGVYFIYDGKIKIFNTGKNGKQQIVRLATTGELFGLRPESESNYLVSSATLENSVLCFIDKATLYNAIKENSALAIGLLDFYSREIAYMEIRQKHLAQLSAAEKVAEALLLIKKKFGKESPKGILLDVQLSRQDIADLAGITSTETVRILAKFKKLKIIDSIQKKIIILDNQQLLEFLLAHCCEKNNQFTNLSKCYSHVVR